ncbi:MAG: response regulator transcription factor [Desulfohalobiaceae bacterium]|nr:response regulator transcription factor [Desulfohalobiaceae bacterium]
MHSLCSKKPIQVFLADDHSIVLSGLKRIVEECPDMEVLAEADNGHDAMRIVFNTELDVAVLDISMPGYDGLEVLSQIRAAKPELPVIILTMHEEEHYIFRALEAGAKGYITKRAAPEQLVSAIRQTAAGKSYIPADIAELLAIRLARGAKPNTPLDNLSLREMQVLRNLALGLTNKEIAENYHISVKTVDTYRLRLLKKLNLRNNADISRFAISHNLIEH